MVLREYRNSDGVQIWSLFFDTVHSAVQYACVATAEIERKEDNLRSPALM